MNHELSPRQKRFVTAMLTAKTIDQAAKVVGVTERTGQKYLADPAVKRALGRALDKALGQTTRQVVVAMTSALETLEAIHTDSDAPTGARVSAARAILDAGPRLREALDLAERVTMLEEQLLAGAK